MELKDASSKVRMGNPMGRTKWEKNSIVIATLLCMFTSCTDGRKVGNLDLSAIDEGNRDRPLLTDSILPCSKTLIVKIDGGFVKPAPSTCHDASSEPNNTALTATKLTTTGLIPGWEICYRGDIDQYTVSNPGGKKMMVEVIFKDLKGDLDVAMIAPNGFVYESRTETDNESIIVGNDAGWNKEYILGVWGYCFDTNTYDLRISIK